MTEQELSIFEDLGSIPSTGKIKVIYSILLFEKAYFQLLLNGVLYVDQEDSRSPLYELRCFQMNKTCTDLNNYGKLLVA